MLKRYILFFAIIIFLAGIFTSVFYNRQYFTQNYDISYWKERFEHSQWSLPLSKRIIGDDGLYAYVGYTLAKGADPSIVNAEAPPIGKYMIGFSILLFKNPIYYSLFFGLGALVLFYLLALKLIRDRFFAFIATLLLFLDPLFSAQLWKPWLDIAQLFFLLANVLLLYIAVDSKRKYLLIFLSGLMLGFFAMTKLPILLPFIFFLDVAFLLIRKQVKTMPIFTVGMILGVLVPYAYYFYLGHSFIDFLKLQKFILNFYISSQLKANLFSVLQTILSGGYYGLNNAGVSRVLEWTLAWPAMLLFSAFAFVKMKQEASSLILKGVFAFILISILIFSVIPFYPRYLLVVIPFMYLLGVYFLSTFVKRGRSYLIVVLLSAFALINFIYYSIPKPQTVINGFTYNFSNQYFQDMYLDIASVSNINSGEEFYLIAKNLMDKIGVKAIDITQEKTDIPLLADNGTVDLTITYHTYDLGSFKESKKINLQKVNDVWKVIWKWSDLMLDFKPGYTIYKNVEIGKRGSIIQDNNKIAYDDSGYLISINPYRIDTLKEQKMLELLGTHSGLIPIHIQNAYLENSIPNTYVPIFTNIRPLKPEDIQVLLTYPGVDVVSASTRVYDTNKISPESTRNTNFNECCTRLYSSTNYHGMGGYEKRYEDILVGYNGGRLQIIDNNGNVIRTVLDKDKKDGRDVIIN